MSDSGSGLASARRVWRERCRASGSGRLLVTQEEELSHSPAEVDRDAHRCGLGKVQLMEGAIRDGREGWRCKRDGNGFQELSPGLFSGARRAQELTPDWVCIK